VNGTKVPSHTELHSGIKLCKHNFATLVLHTFRKGSGIEVLRNLFFLATFRKGSEVEVLRNLDFLATFRKGSEIEVLRNL